MGEDIPRDEVVGTAKHRAKTVDDAIMREDVLVEATAHLKWNSFGPSMS